jgi:hypothetical protein
MFILDDRPLSLDTAFTHNQIKYPANWLRLASPEEREAIGITEMPDPAPYDQRFYWSPDLPKDHNQLIAQWVDTTRTTANTLLAPSDWQVIREIDNGKPMDPQIKAWRENIRIKSSLKITAINATVDTPALASYITSAAYTTWDDIPSTGITSTFNTDGVVSFSNGSTTGGF